MKTVIIFIVIFLLFGCSTQPVKNNRINQDTVVLVFENPPKQSGKGMQRIDDSFLTYIGRNGFPIKIPQLGDTIIELPVHDGFMEIGHQYKSVQTNYFYLKGGDTVIFSYDSLQLPFARSTLSSSLTFQYNFEYNIPYGHTDSGLSPVSLLILPLSEEQQIAFFDQYSKYIEQYKHSFTVSKEGGMLDSAFVKYYDYRLKYMLESHLYLKKQMENWKGHNTNKRYNFNLFNDSLTYFISYYHYLPTSIHLDSVLEYPLPPVSKKLAVYKFLRYAHLIPNIGKSDKNISGMYQKILLYGDTVVVDRIKEEFTLPVHDISPDDMRMVLLGLNGDSLTFDKVLKKNKGKVMYIDFWASWCAPCISNFPSTLELKEKYKDQDVVFIYIAKGDSYSAWPSAVEKHMLNSAGSENYFLVNNKAGLIKKLQINDIPRYIIISRDGTIVNANAPRPTQKEEIIKELDQYLQKNESKKTTTKY